MKMIAQSSKILVKCSLDLDKSTTPVVSAAANQHQPTPQPTLRPVQQSIKYTALGKLLSATAIVKPASHKPRKGLNFYGSAILPYKVKLSYLQNNNPGKRVLHKSRVSIQSHIKRDNVTHSDKTVEIPLLNE